MDKETLSNYGWIVICVLVLAVMIALATPFGSFISEAMQSTTKGLFDVNKSALDSTGLISIDTQGFDIPDMNYDTGISDKQENIIQTIAVPFSSMTQGKKIMPDGSIASENNTHSTLDYIDVSALDETFVLRYSATAVKSAIRIAQYDSDYNSLSNSFGLNKCTSSTTEYDIWEIKKINGCKYIRIFISSSGGLSNVNGELCNMLS